MDGGDDEIQLRKNFVFKIERAVTQNVALDAGENPEAGESLVEILDRGHLRFQPIKIESVRLNRAAAVIRDAEILQTELLRRRRHFFERVMSIARISVAMKCSAQIRELDQARQFSGSRRLKFAAI